MIISLIQSTVFLLSDQLYFSGTDCISPERQQSVGRYNPKFIVGLAQLCRSSSASVWIQPGPDTGQDMWVPITFSLFLYFPISLSNEYWATKVAVSDSFQESWEDRCRQNQLRSIADIFTNSVGVNFFRLVVNVSLGMQKVAALSKVYYDGIWICDI